MTRMPTVGLSARGSQAAIVEEFRFGSGQVAHEHTAAESAVNRAELSLAVCTSFYVANQHWVK